jgi:hypothetical protein
MKYLTRGTVAAVLSIAAIMAGAFGYDAIGTFLNDPGTITTALTLAGAVGTLYAGIVDGIKKAPEAE